MYTPYRLSPGGGEKVFLTALSSYQQLGYHILLFLDPAKFCQTIDCIRQAAEKLLIEDIDWTRVKVILDARRHSHISTWYNVDAYFEIGNTKAPRNFGLGRRHNLYTCQFPFDLDTPLSSESLDILGSYDDVMVYSNYVHFWYMNYTLNDIIRSNGRVKLPPVRVVAPPVGGKHHETLTTNSLTMLHQKQGASSTFNILMLGRIFYARQNKGYHVAVPTFKRLLQADHGEHDLHLHIIGALSQIKGSKEYLAQLQSNASTLPITFHTGIAEDKLQSLLRNGSIFWHMTGIDQPRDHFDPASLEHFGIAHLEAMAYGMIPIVTDRGGPIETTRHGIDGYHAASPEEFVRYTLQILRMDSDERVKMRRAAIESSKRFSPDKFIANMMKLVRQG